MAFQCGARKAGFARDDAVIDGGVNGNVSQLKSSQKWQMLGRLWTNKASLNRQS